MLGHPHLKTTGKVESKEKKKFQIDINKARRKRRRNPPRSLIKEEEDECLNITLELYSR